MTAPQSKETPSTRLHAIVEGRVQAVGFRAFVQLTAGELGLTGWVRNRWNGSVEVMAEGSDEAIDRLEAALRRGPRSAFVTDVHIERGPATGEFTHFSIRTTE